MGLPKTVEGRQVWLEETGGRCYVCWRRLTLETVEVDHVIPTVLGGPTVRWNLKPICGPCNKRKGSRLKYVIAE